MRRAYPARLRFPDSARAALARWVDLDLARPPPAGILAADMSKRRRTDPPRPTETKLDALAAPLVSHADHNMGQWVSRTAQRHPERLAWADDSRRLSYREADDRVQRWTRWLLERGIQSGDRIALWLGNRVEMLEALFAGARVGAIVLPVNARLTAPEVAFQLDDCEPRMLFVEPTWLDTAQEATRLGKRTPPTIIEVGPTLSSQLSQTQPTDFCAALTPEDPVLLMYTSGTTGKPKGAVLPHRKALYNSLNAERYFELRESDKVLVVAPLFHSLGLQILALPAIYAGASVRLQEGFDARRVWHTIEKEGITYFGGVPTMHQRLLDALGQEGSLDAPPASLRFAFTAGAAASKELIRSFHAHGLQLKQGYGQTETSMLTCLAAEDALAKAGSVGRPVPHAELRLIDVSTIDLPPVEWREVQIGEVGEIVVRGPITMLGYWQRPEATAQTIRDGWLRTGDLATQDADGDITLIGRAREMYISGGENVYPAEIEATLVEHPDVAEAAVVPIHDPKWGETGRAHIVLIEGGQLDGRQLETWLADRLARFKCPREIVFEAALPRTASGKVQKHRLQSRGSRGNEGKP